jgi:aspartyl-tRNA(Asn)/glutamyl-tRNA(Gln) amidotransferase subunit A
LIHSSERIVTTEDFLFVPIRQQAQAIRSGKLSIIELTESYLKRLEKYGPALNAFVTIMRETALRDAKIAEADLKSGKDRGLLHGIPFGVKDLLATKDAPTTWGAKPYRDQKFDFDATSITKLKDSGAILIAKLSMVELAGGFGYDAADASFTGPGRNPWNTNFWSGGSSSGSASAVSAGLVAFAIGSETSGSIITPASYCGVTGLRPTYGRISRHGAMPLCWSLDKLGPITRSADCAGLVLQAIAGKDTKELTSVDRKFEHLESPPKRRYKLAIVRGSRTGGQPEVKKNFEESLKPLTEFADIEEKEVSLPSFPFGAVINMIVNVEGASAFRELLESGKAKELQDEGDRTGGYAGLFIPAVDYLHAQRVRNRMKKAMHELYSKYDAIICPSRSTVANPVDIPFAKSYPGTGSPATTVIPAGNAVGQPGITVPNGFGENGLPTGLSFTGKIWSEATLIDLAREYQRRTDWHLRQPKLKA